MTKRIGMIPEEKFDVLETHLAGTLKRVAPPNGLIHRLRGRIHMPAREEIVLRLRDWRRLIFVLGGVISGLLLIITVARSFYHLMGRRDVG